MYMGVWVVVCAYVHVCVLVRVRLYLFAGAPLSVCGCVGKALRGTKSTGGRGSQKDRA